MQMMTVKMEDPIADGDSEGVVAVTPPAPGPRAPSPTRIVEDLKEHEGDPSTSPVRARFNASSPSAVASNALPPPAVAAARVSFEAPARARAGGGGQGAVASRSPAGAARAPGPRAASVAKAAAPTAAVSRPSYDSSDDEEDSDDPGSAPVNTPAPQGNPRRQSRVDPDTSDED